jgi:hypothetical protein
MANGAAAKPPDLHFGLDVIQVGDQIMVQISVGDNFGLSNTLILPHAVARDFSRAIKAAVEKAEVTVVKPASLIQAQ